MSSEGKPAVSLWVLGWRGWLILGIAALALALMYWNGIAELLLIWGRAEEYSHGYFIPLISLLMVWQNRNHFTTLRFDGIWFGTGILLLGIFLFLLGTLSTIYLVVHYSLIIVLLGLALSYTGWSPLKFLWVPLAYLAFMIPFPQFLYNQVSFWLQLISSEIGVAVIRWFGISVFLEGNVIDLGSYKLQVVDACSGLRYLFPLMSFGFLMAYLFKGPIWQRTVIFLSTIPITVLMNSFRIGVIGVLVEYFGIEMAEGFLHDFEGWIIFMACTAILLGEAWLFWRFSSTGGSFWDSFNLDLPETLPASMQRQTRRVPMPLIASVALLVLAAAGTDALVSRPSLPLDRISFAVFPDRVGSWDGNPGSLERNILDELDLDDYYIGDFIAEGSRPVNFYVAYYGAQEAGAAAHSPRSCIPGGGWKITDLQPRVLSDILIGDDPLRVNRLTIQRGDERQLVYYWFEQRGRIITSEYAVKWYLFWDALTRNRTDGALIRLTTAVQPWEDWTEGDERLTEFSREVHPQLTAFLPN